MTYRYVYGLEKLSVSVSPITNGAGSITQNGRIKLWYHKDRLGSTDYLTDNVQGKIMSYVSYDQWGDLLKEQVLQAGVRQLDLVTEYTGHPYDAVLGVYYARARMYDAGDRRWCSTDSLKGNVITPPSINLYVYVLDNPLKWVDPDGLRLQLMCNANDRDLYLMALQQLTNDTLEITRSPSPDDYDYPPDSGEPKYTVTIKSKNDGKFPVGTSLIRELIDGVYTICLYVYPENDWTIGNNNSSISPIILNHADNGIGTGSRLYMDFSDSAKAVTCDKKGTIVATYIPYYIILGHELIHAYHNMTGTASKVLYKDDPRYYEDTEWGLFIYQANNGGKAQIHIAPVEELKTVGLNYYPLLVCFADITKDSRVLCWQLSDIDRNQYGKLVNGQSGNFYTENALRAEHDLPLRIEYYYIDVSTNKEWDAAIAIFPDYLLPSYPPVTP